MDLVPPGDVHFLGLPARTAVLLQVGTVAWLLGLPRLAGLSSLLAGAWAPPAGAKAAAGVAESARAHSYYLSKQVQKTAEFWLLNFGC